MPAPLDLAANRSQFHGQVVDADGHLYIQPDVAAQILRDFKIGPELQYYTDYVKSEEYRKYRAENRTDEGLWCIKGMGALGAFDPVERGEAIERMGIHAQLLFPNLGTNEFRVDSDEGRLVCQRYNDYAIDFNKRSGNRARTVCEINMHNVDWAVKELDRILKLGAKAVTLPCHVPPGGVSPAHEKWDPFWARLEEANVPGLLHIANQGLLHCTTPEDMMLPNPAWGDATALRNKPLARAGGEEAISPYFMLVVHMAPELWLQTMIMGKVFERFPRLRFGVVELAAEWVGPMAERMDLWANFMNKVGVKYDMKPSEYLRRNVRVTPVWSENLPKMIERFGLKEVYVFSTDYPHLEGGRDPIVKFRKHTDAVGEGYEKAFFVDNGTWIMPG